MIRARTPRRPPGGLRRDLLADEQGSFLVEILISATIVLVVGLGALAMIDRTTELSGQQRTQAVAGNVAQVELDTVRAFPLAQLSNLRRSDTKQVGGINYAITTRADWINDTAMTPNCTTPGATADYLKVTTSVTYPGIRSRRPAVLDTIISPPVRSFGANQGSLAVAVTDRNGAGVPDLTVGLAGPATFSDTTNANGCILWGYLPAGSGYTASFSRAGWVMPNGSAAGGGPVSVIGDATANANFQFDRGGSIRTNFKVKSPTGVLIDTKPKLARVENSGPPAFSRTYDIGSTATSLDTSSQGLLFPFANPYSIHADNCLAAKPPTPTSAAVTPGGSIQAADTVLPAQRLTVQSNGASNPVNNATVRVITACGTVYQRQTNSQGQLDDPGFPYGTGFTLCATNGTRKRVLTGQTNTNFTNPGTVVTLDIATNGSTTTNPNSCP